MSEWSLKKLEDLIDIKHGWAFKGEYFSDEPTDYVLLTPGNFFIGGGFKGDKLKYYTGKVPDEYILKQDELIITMTDLSKEGDTLGYPAKIPKSKKRFLHNQRLGLVKLISNDVNLDFLYWLMRTKNYQRTIVNNASGSTVRHTSPSKIKEYEFKLPPLNEQKEISKTLNVLENKIDLLHRQNETLEAIVQTLFKRWFVEFEFPDENGLPYKSSGGKMVSSELYEIPEGWRVGKIGNICSILNEVIKPNAKERNLYFHYSIPAFDDGYSPKKEYGKDILSNKFCVKSNTILVSKLNPRKPRIWPILEIDEKKSISSTEFQVIKPIKRSYYCFIFNMFKSRYVRKEMAQRATGTSGSHQRIRPDDILDIDVVISRENLILDFENVAKKMIEKIDSNLKTIQTLSKTRDILLPKLMSGQIRVK